jgi:hypothetical protein
MITIKQIEQQEQIKDQAQNKANEERNKWFLMIAQYNEENEVQYEDRPKKNTQRHLSDRVLSLLMYIFRAR